MRGEVLSLGMTVVAELELQIGEELNHFIHSTPIDKMTDPPK